MHVLRDVGHLLARMVEEYGDHLPTCDIWELRNSGRIIDMPEREVCSCDWAKNRDELLEAKENGLSGKYSDDQAETMIQQYMHENDLAKIKVG